MEDLAVTITSRSVVFEDESPTPKKRLNLREKIKLQRRLKNMGIVKVKKPRIITEQDRRISKFNFPDGACF